MDRFLIGAMYMFLSFLLGIFIGYDAATNEIQEDCIYGNTVRFDKVIYTCIKKAP